MLRPHESTAALLGSLATPQIQTHNASMWRAVLTIIVAAALGSLISTLAMTVLAGGTGGLSPTRVILAFSSGTMFFTLPGAFMLLGLQAILTERGIGTEAASLVVIASGAVAGGIVSALISPALAPWGAFYGCVTAVAFLLCQRLFYPPIRHQG